MFVVSLSLNISSHEGYAVCWSTYCVIYHLSCRYPLSHPLNIQPLSQMITHRQPDSYILVLVDRLFDLIMLYTTTNERSLFEELIIRKKYSGDQTLWLDPLTEISSVDLHETYVCGIVLVVSGVVLKLIPKVMEISMLGSDWLTPHHPIPNFKFPPIAAL